jgi:hypothetical protein
VNDFGERDGLTQGFGEDDPVECVEKRVLSGQLVALRESDWHVDGSVVISINHPLQKVEGESYIQGFYPGTED